ncbi:V-type ATP synthase subunit D [Mycobacterium sp.]|uniref:V-type ATP synthase subunit D n=1 Tax=Mycobacterium sp. TaxID=1785 RepID=UPI002BDF47A6|nr:V-type ATP synthase subunit D [Mycobacterium sp.]HME47837.1 V-type ATP synthase subunit D [Mycobacterium sp.]
MGRRWLIDRLELAERGVTLLEEKLQLLSSLRDRLQRRVDETRRDWQSSCREADTWGLRATLLGGQRAVELAAPTGHAAVSVGWATTAGVRYPDTAQCVLPPENDPTVIHTGSASVRAAQAYRAAVVAAADHAAAQSALATVEREFGTTKLRVRALSRHWLPRLRRELARVELELEEQDRDAAIRVRLTHRPGR